MGYNPIRVLSGLGTSCILGYFRLWQVSNFSPNSGEEQELFGSVRSDPQKLLWLWQQRECQIWRVYFTRESQFLQPLSCLLEDSGGVATSWGNFWKNRICHEKWVLISLPLWVGICLKSNWRSKEGENFLAVIIAKALKNIKVGLDASLCLPILSDCFLDQTRCHHSKACLPWYCFGLEHDAS